jgi:hypothetical protein
VISFESFPPDDLRAEQFCSQATLRQYMQQERAKPKVRARKKTFHAKTQRLRKGAEDLLSLRLCVKKYLLTGKTAAK